MIYNEWYEEHAKKHATIMKKLEGLDEYDIVQYFIFENMVEKEPDFCELYKTNTKCHEMYELNCYMCGCPHFRFNQTPQKQDDLEFHSICSISSKRGKRTVREVGDVAEVHQDCSGCTIPHGEDYIFSNFDEDWLEMMKNVKKLDL
ncbi:MAG: Unknown protein [uncultured Sulfurovum sp.]|uniref:Uncharacterized protein n=1 Tax=uncultured Sulfurovum sp. TaxID=269237 RepID=A0A6S6S8V5_9BACT|nr:MAG: Unknown protein [uncultured Sulfurovum sp.]